MTEPTDPNPIFVQFKSDVCYCYPHLSGNCRYTNHNLKALLQHTGSYRDISHNNFREYYHQFLSYTAYLIGQNCLSEWEQNSSHLRSFPQPIGAQVLQQLSVKKPDVLPDNGYKFANIHKVTSFIFNSGHPNARDSVPTVVKSKPVEQISVSDLVQAMSNLTKVFTVTMS